MAPMPWPASKQLLESHFFFVVKQGSHKIEDVRVILLWETERAWQLWSSSKRLGSGNSSHAAMIVYAMMLFNCITGPRLHQTFSHNGNQGLQYSPNAIERYSDGAIRLFNFAWGATSLFWPIILFILFRRGVFDLDSLPDGLRYLRTFGILAGTVLVTRGIGRSLNSEYASFSEVLSQACNGNRAAREGLSNYDCEFYAWPVDFPENYRRPSLVARLLQRVSRMPLSPSRIFTYMIARSIGRPIMYPGSMAVFNYQMIPHFIAGRKQLVEKLHGKRRKVATEDGNEIDTIFIDRRETNPTERGRTLVVCCDGNAAFYEVGSTLTVAKADYSVLGWNHPGFGGSSGLPFPSQERNAIDAVMQYAIHLGFRPENILIYGWSIGAYTASHAAKTWPDVKGVILDATFDDITHLSTARMPEFLSGLAVSVVRDHLHLNNADLICQYNGPLLLIRRSMDFLMMSVPGDMSSNRANHLLLSIMRARFPDLVSEETMPIFKQIFAARRNHSLQMLSESLGVRDALCYTMLKSYVEQHGPAYPCNIGKDLGSEAKIPLAFYVASRLMKQYEGSHVDPLPTDYIQEPWSL